jgi:hypothetical protein
VGLTLRTNGVCGLIQTTRWLTYESLLQGHQVQQPVRQLLVGRLHQCWRALLCSKAPDVPQCLALWDRLSAVHNQLEGSKHADKIDVLQKLSNRLSKSHLSFNVPREQARDNTMCHYEMEVMFSVLHGLDFVHATPGLFAKHMADRHFGVDPCDDEYEGGRKCHHYVQSSMCKSPCQLFTVNWWGAFS